MTVGRLAERARLSPGATTTVVDRWSGRASPAARATRSTAAASSSRSHPSCGRMGEQLHGSMEEGVEALAIYTDEQLEFLIEFLRGNVAYQEERMRRLEELKVAETG